MSRKNSVPSQDVRIPLVRNIQGALASPLTAVSGILLAAAGSSGLFYAGSAPALTCCAVALAAGVFLFALGRRASGGGYGRPVCAPILSAIFFASALFAIAAPPVYRAAGKGAPGARVFADLCSAFNMSSRFAAALRDLTVLLFAAAAFAAGVFFVGIFKTFGDGVPRKKSAVLPVCAVCAAALPVAVLAFGLLSGNAAKFDKARLAEYPRLSALPVAFAAAFAATFCALSVKVYKAVKRSDNV